MNREELEKAKQEREEARKEIELDIKAIEELNEIMGDIVKLPGAVKLPKAKETKPFRELNNQITEMLGSGVFNFDPSLELGDKFLNTYVTVDEQEKLAKSMRNYQSVLQETVDLSEEIIKNTTSEKIKTVFKNLAEKAKSTWKKIDGFVEVLKNKLSSTPIEERITDLQMEILEPKKSLNAYENSLASFEQQIKDSKNNIERFAAAGNEKVASLEAEKENLVSLEAQYKNAKDILVEVQASFDKIDNRIDALINSANVEQVGAIESKIAASRKVVNGSDVDQPQKDAYNDIFDKALDTLNARKEELNAPKTERKWPPGMQGLKGIKEKIKTAKEERLEEQQKFEKEQESGKDLN